MDSDIDLVVATTKMTESNKGRLLAELARAMRLAHITDVVAIISKARVPIIKFVTTEGAFSRKSSEEAQLTLRQTECRCLAQPNERYIGGEDYQPVPRSYPGRSSAYCGRQGLLIAKIHE
jgi:hypothetical protein